MWSNLLGFLAHKMCFEQNSFWQRRHIVSSLGSKTWLQLWQVLGIFLLEKSFERNLILCLFVKVFITNSTTELVVLTWIYGYFSGKHGGN